ncbi:sulfite reductase flavoprotein subunit alpha [Acidicapsa dinghuensis]|uniref:Sulfite reductase flavoprotein subunit alpha n=1 Tax=Acidicapsa dinghuensis TaxID=2218256 RepID=A0ABW1EMA4_9BACT|nr:flavodoxin domain-containing protein [Acidicapsa dinghuensis]
MTPTIPFIPDNAPFTQEQRAWLNGLLAGMFSSAPQAAVTAKPSRRVAVLYGSQSGTAESMARKLAKELKAQGHAPALSTLVGYTPAALATESCALILASTYGDGDAPDGVQPFYEQLCLEHFPCMDKLSYAVFALGDRHYEHFCKFGKDLDSKLASLGANRLADRVDCDVDVEAPFAQWKTAMIARLNEDSPLSSRKAPGITKQLNALQLAESSGNPEAPTAKAFTRDHPLLASVIDKKSLTHVASTKSTLHVALSIEGTGLRYEAGDACGVIPTNDLNLVAEILQKMRFNGNERVPGVKTSTTTLHDALTHERQITRLNRKIIQGFATRGNCTPLLDLLLPEHQIDLDAYAYDRGLIDLLTEYPGVIDDPNELVGLLPKLTPRLYSISSSPAAHVGQIHTTVAVVRFTAHNRDRGGVCSTYFADRTSVADRLPIYIQPNKKFKLPSDSDAPIIMIGPGTGIAPFRGFLHERRALGHKGKNWLFFGERSSATDYLYRDELESMYVDGHLARLDTAFSRDHSHKAYVQDRMIEQAQQFWSWLQNGASIYVCGDASRMAKDVHSTLCRIVQEQGAMSGQAAEEYVGILKEDHRYHRDVY